MAPNTSNLFSNRNILLAHLSAFICIVMWGVSFVSTKVLHNNGMQPVEIYIYRFTLAYLLIILFKRGKLLSHNWRDEGLLCLCGILAGSIYFLAENFALQYTLVSNVSLLTATSPLLTAILIGLMIKSDRPGRGMITGMCVAFVGVGCIIFNSSFNIEIKRLGDILAMMAALSWALYSIVLKKLNATYDVWFISRKTFFYGVLTALPFLLVEPPHYNIPDIWANKAVLGNLLFLGIGASMICYVLWAIAVGKLGAVTANNYLYIQPIITLIFSVICLDENVSAIGYVGCGLILTGLWLGDHLSRRQSLK